MLSDQFVYMLSDNLGESDAATLTITITGVNDPPEVEGSLFVTATEDDNEFFVDLLAGASDRDNNDELTVTSLSRITGDSAGIVPGQTSLGVDPGAYGHLQNGESEHIVYVYQIIDRHGGIVGRTVSITITGLNDAPAATENRNTISKDSAATATGNLITDDDGFGVDSDADAGDMIFVLNVNGLSSFVTGSHGVLFWNRNGDYSYDVSDIDPTVLALAPGDVLEDTFIYTLSDEAGDTDIAALTIRIVAPVVNDNWHFAGDEDDSNDLSVGDIVRNANDTFNAGTLTAVYGVSGFGHVTSGAQTGALAAHDEIADAIETVGGGTLVLLEGIYAESVSVEKDVTLSGATGVAADVVITPAGNATGIVISSEVTDVSIEHLSVTGAQDGINVRGANGIVTFTNVETINNAGTGIRIASNVLGDVHFDRVVATGNNDHGIVAGGIGGDLSLSNVVSDDNSGIGILVFDVGNVHFDTVTAIGNATGALVAQAAAFSDFGGEYSRNDSHGLHFIDIAGGVSLARTRLEDNDADGDGNGDGLNATDGADGDTRAIGGALYVQAATIRDTDGPSAGQHQQRGVFVDGVGGAITFEEENMFPFAGQKVTVTGHDQDGIRIEQSVNNDVWFGQVDADNNGGDGIRLSGPIAIVGEINPITGLPRIAHVDILQVSASDNTGYGIRFPQIDGLVRFHGIVANNNGLTGLAFLFPVKGAVHTIEDGTPTSASGNGGDGMHFSFPVVGDITIEDMTAIDNAGTGVALAALSRAGDAGNVTFRDSTVNGNRQGVFVGEAISFETWFSTFSNNDDHGIELVDIGRNAAGRVVLTATQLHDNDADADGIGDGLHATRILNDLAINSKLRLRGVSIRDTDESGDGQHQQRGVYVDGVGGDVEIDEFTNFGPDFLEVYESVVSGHDQDGVRIKQDIIGDVEVRNTTVDSNGGHGIVLEGAISGSAILNPASASHNGGHGIVLEGMVGGDVFSGGVVASHNGDNGISLLETVNGDVDLIAVVAESNSRYGIRANSIGGAVEFANVAANNNFVSGIFVLGDSGPVDFDNVTANANHGGGITNIGLGIRFATINGTVNFQNVTASTNLGTGIKMGEVHGDITFNEVVTDFNGFFDNLSAGRGIVIHEANGNVTFTDVSSRFNTAHASGILFEAGAPVQGDVTFTNVLLGGGSAATFGGGIDGNLGIIGDPNAGESYFIYIVSHVDGNLWIDGNGNDLVMPLWDSALSVGGDVSLGDAEWLLENAQLSVVGTLTVGDGATLCIDAASTVEGAVLEVEPGGTVKGEGTIDADTVINNGAITPGSSPGSLTVDADYQQGPEGTLVLEIAGTTPGDEHDVLDITGDAIIAGEILFIFTDGFVSQPGDTFEALVVGGSLDFSRAEIRMQNLPPDTEVFLLGGTVVAPPNGGTLLVNDPNHPGRQILIVGGTADNDHIDFKSKKHGREIEVRLNGEKLGRYSTDALSRLVAFGGDGDDKIKVDDHIDLPAKLYGGAGNDRIHGGSGPSVVLGGAGNDLLFGGRGDDLLDGEDGHDLLVGEDGNDILLGRDGHDILLGGDDDDILDGGDGNDLLLGGRGNDTLLGGPGFDLLWGGRGIDELFADEEFQEQLLLLLL